MGQDINDMDTVELDEENCALTIIDQTRLPGKIRQLHLCNAKEIRDAIYHLQVRGAPAIGVAAALGMYVLASRYETEDMEEFCENFHRDKEYLNSARPTAVNLSWALNRMEDVLLANRHLKPVDAVHVLGSEAKAIRDEDIEVCRRIGENGLTLLQPGAGILTHCNAGKLATVRYGTATSPIYLGQERGYDFRVFCDETRPLLQGARLTAFELQEAGVDTTLICDNMSGMVMKNGWVDAVFVGADRVAANGDTANKIGTSVVATVAARYDVPVYVCAPTSTIDIATPKGTDIIIEERAPEEVTQMWYEKRMAPEGVKVFNPAFDVTDHDLITGIVTECGIAFPPYQNSLEDILARKQAGWE